MLPFIKSEPEDQNYDIEYDYLDVKNKNIEAHLKRTKESKGETMSRREVNKLRQRTRRATETEEQRNKRRERAKLRARWMRAQESEDQRLKRREAAKERKRIERALETEEQTAKRRELARHRIRLVRAMESEEEKEQRRLRARERVKLKRALELEDEKMKRREIAKERARRIRANESEEQRQRRNERGRERMKRKRALELLRSYGYTDHQLLLLFNHYMETLGQHFENNDDIDYIKIKEFLIGTGKLKKKNQDIQETNLTVLEHTPNNKFYNVPSEYNQPSRSQINHQTVDTQSKLLDNRLDPPPQTKRISNLNYLFEQLQQIALHSTNSRCNFNTISFVSEKLDGLCSELTLKCNVCRKMFVASLNSTQEGINLNESVVSISETIGIGYMGLKTFFSSIGILPLTEIKYLQVESELKTFTKDNNSISDTESDNSDNV